MPEIDIGIHNFHNLYPLLSTTLDMPLDEMRIEYPLQENDEQESDEKENNYRESQINIVSMETVQLSTSNTLTEFIPMQTNEMTQQNEQLMSIENMPFEYGNQASQTTEQLNETTFVPSNESTSNEYYSELFQTKKSHKSIEVKRQNEQFMSIENMPFIYENQTSQTTEQQNKIIIVPSNESTSNEYDSKLPQTKKPRKSIEIKKNINVHTLIIVIKHSLNQVI